MAMVAENSRIICCRTSVMVPRLPPVAMGMPRLYMNSDSELPSEMRRSSMVPVNSPRFFLAMISLPIHASIKRG